MMAEDDGDMRSKLLRELHNLRKIRPLGLNFLDCGQLVGEKSADSSIFWSPYIDTAEIVDSYMQEGIDIMDEGEILGEETGKPPKFLLKPFVYEKFDEEKDEIVSATASGYGILKMMADYFYLPTLLQEEIEAILTKKRSPRETYCLFKSEFAYVFYPNLTIFPYVLLLQKQLQQELRENGGASVEHNSFVKLLKHFQGTIHEQIPKLKHESSIIFLKRKVEVSIPSDDDNDMDMSDEGHLTYVDNVAALTILLAIMNYTFSSDFAKTLAHDIITSPTRSQALPAVEKLQLIQWPTFTPAHAIAPLVRSLSFQM
jgi:hypothetical protein